MTVHAPGSIGRTACGRALRAFSDEKIMASDDQYRKAVDRDPDERCWECDTMTN